MLLWKQQTLRVEGPTCYTTFLHRKKMEKCDAWKTPRDGEWKPGFFKEIRRVGKYDPVTVWFFFFFVFSISVSIVTVSIFSTPPSFPSPPKHQFPFSISSCCLTQPTPLFFFFLASLSCFCFFPLFYYNYYYCKVYLEETFVYYTITILS